MAFRLEACHKDISAGNSQTTKQAPRASAFLLQGQSFATEPRDQVGAAEATDNDETALFPGGCTPFPVLLVLLVSTFC